MIIVDEAVAHRKRTIKHQPPGSQMSMSMISNCNKGKVVLDMKRESREAENIDSSNFKNKDL